MHGYLKMHPYSNTTSSHTFMLPDFLFRYKWHRNTNTVLQSVCVCVCFNATAFLRHVSKSK